MPNITIDVFANMKYVIDQVNTNVDYLAPGAAQEATPNSCRSFLTLEMITPTMASFVQLLTGNCN
jgi:hypothetical protein